MKEHFREYTDICERIDELSYKQYELRNALYGITGIAYDRIPSDSHGNDALVSKITELDEVNAEISRLKVKKMDLYENHLKEINKIENRNHRKALRCYYLLRMDISSIEKAMNCSRQHFYKVKKQAEIEFMRQNATN